MTIDIMPKKDGSAKHSSRPRIVVEEDTSKEKDSEDSMSSIEKTVVEPEISPVEKKVTSFSMVDKELPEKFDDTDTVVEEKENVVMDDVQEEPETEVLSETKEEVVDDEEKNVSSSEISDWLQSVRPDTTDVKHGPSKGMLFGIFLTLLILAALGGGVYYYRTNVDSSTETMTAEVTPVKTSEVTAAPTVALSPTTAPLDLSKYSVQILNGSGIAGEAGRAQTLLQSAGFKDFKTGNAGSFAFIATEVNMKKDVPDEVFTKIKTALEVNYQEVTKSTKVLEESSAFHVVVTVGKKK